MTSVLIPPSLREWRGRDKKLGAIYMNDHGKKKDFDRMMIEAVQANLSFIAWQSMGGVVEKCEMKLKAFRRDYNELEFELKNSVDADLEKVISGDRRINIFVPEASITFSSELKQVVNETRIKVYIPIDYNFHERRKHERIRPSKTCHLTFENRGQMFKRAIFDISHGGVAIILPKSEKVSVSKGKEYPVILLEVDNRKMKLKAECTHACSIDRFKMDSLPYGGYKISFRFKDMSKEDKTFLSEYIINELLLQNLIKTAN